MMLNETQQKWSNIITEEFGIKDSSKLNWMSQYAQNHEIYEGVQATGNVSQGIYATPLSTMGMGTPYMPYNTDNTPAGVAGGAFGAQVPGSGDVPVSSLTMALQVAAVTIGLELVPVIPATGPLAVLSYMDTPYAGGKDFRTAGLTTIDGKGENHPIYVKLACTVDEATVNTTDNTKIKYLGKSRIDGKPIFMVPATAIADDKTVADAFGATITGVTGADTTTLDVVTSAADHIQGFANFFNGSDDPMSRGENETGTGNTIGARMYSKIVQMGSYEVTGAVTRQQLQDMPLYGVDVVGKVLEAMQNEISQAINNRILDRVFKLGVDNAENQCKYQDVNLNLYISEDKKNVNEMSAYKYYLGTDGKQPATIAAKEAGVTIVNTSADNIITAQRRIMSRILAAANLIANVSRRGRANWVVTNAQVLSALQDCAAFVVAPMANTLTQDGSQSLYFAGSIAGLNLYVDPYMPWDDTRVCVGRKSNGSDPGVVFMPYILADTVQVVAEGTMAPKLLVNSRFAIVDAGFWPEQNYYTFMVESPNGLL